MFLQHEERHQRVRVDISVSVCQDVRSLNEDPNTWVGNTECEFVSDFASASVRESGRDLRQSMCLT